MDKPRDKAAAFIDCCHKLDEALEALNEFYPCAPANGWFTEEQAVAYSAVKEAHHLVMTCTQDIVSGRSK